MKISSVILLLMMVVLIGFSIGDTFSDEINDILLFGEAEDAKEKKSDEKIEEFKTNEELNQIAEEKFEKYKDMDLVELATKDKFKGYDDHMARDRDRNNIEHLAITNISSYEDGAKYAYDEDDMKRAIFIMNALNLQTRVPQLEYDTVVPGIDYEEFQYLQKTKPNEIDIEKLEYSDSPDRDLEDSSNLISWHEHLRGSSESDSISRVSSSIRTLWQAKKTVKYELSTDKTNVKLASTPELYDQVYNQGDHWANNATNLVGFLLVKTEDENNEFNVPADNEIYKVPVELYVEQKPSSYINENFWEVDDPQRDDHKFHIVSHYNIIENENLETKKVDCERTKEYYFPYDAMEENEYYDLDVIYKLRDAPHHKGNPIGEELKPIRWFEMSHSYRSAIYYRNDPDIVNELLFY